MGTVLIKQRTFKITFASIWIFLIKIPKTSFTLIASSTSYMSLTMTPPSFQAIVSIRFGVADTIIQ
jgi:hypothetical protein